MVKTGYENKKPYCIYSSNETYEKHVDLLLIANMKTLIYLYKRT